MSSTSTDPVFFQDLKTKLTKSEDIIDDSLYIFVKAKVHISEILELLDTARRSRRGLTPQVQNELRRLISLVNNTGVISLIKSIEELAGNLKDRLDRSP